MALLSLSFLITSSVRSLWALWSGDLVPVLLLTVLAVRSITGNTFETLSDQAIIFLWLALALSDEGERRREDVIGSGGLFTLKRVLIDHFAFGESWPWGTKVDGGAP